MMILVVAVNIMNHVEQPNYKLVQAEKNIEIRDYSPMILAEVEVPGERQQSIREGFRILADYIFGNNTSEKAPDTNESSEKMSMTAPVIQEQSMGKWKVRFVMPKKYSIETIPKPNSKEVALVALPSKRFAVIRFSGVADDENIRQHTDELKTYLAVRKLKPIGGSIMAFYNPPWTLPLLRRNEVMIEIEKD